MQFTVSRPRLDSLDLLRGLVVMLMALDHVREFMTMVPFDPLDPAKTSLALYLTRWVTHFCAPVFIFLAGTSAFLYQQRGRSRGDVSRFLLTRGLWLVVLNFTVVWFLGWSWSFSLKFIEAGVIYAIGVCMVVLAGVILLPRWAMAVFGLAQVLGHNLLDGVKPEQFGSGGWLWTLLHVKGGFELGATRIDLYYPIIPWMGVMTLGYLFGSIMLTSPEIRQRRLWQMGLSALAIFFALRLTNVYGDLNRWSAQATPLTAFSFFNVQKYPPSLDFLLVTLGPAMLALKWFEQWTETNAPLRWGFRDVLVTFGRVPLFYYLLHLPLCHALALLVSWITGRDVAWLFGAFSDDAHLSSAEPGRGFGLTAIYATWMLALLILYPVCRWFAALKQRRRDAWLSYL
jgi:uncharacterized membrane protein